MFTVHVGPVGSGKTYAMVRQGMFAFEKGETVFSNVELDISGWDDSKGGKYVHWTEPKNILDADFRCGTVLWDELGASVNNREYDVFPLALTIKIIEHRKDHLDFHATVQDDELADKNVRRFYNRVNICHEWRMPFVSLFFPKARRKDLICLNPKCNKNNHLVAKGDKKFLWYGTFYTSKDVHPQDTQNKYKHRSLGRRFFCYNEKITNAYSTTQKVASEALAFHEGLVENSKKRPFFRR